MEKRLSGLWLEETGDEWNVFRDRREEVDTLESWLDSRMIVA